MAFTNEPSLCPPRSARRAAWCQGRVPSAETEPWSCSSPHWSLRPIPPTPWSVHPAGSTTGCALCTDRTVVGGLVFARMPSGGGVASDRASIRWPPLQRLFRRLRRKWLRWLRFCPYRRHGPPHQSPVVLAFRWSDYSAQVVGGIEPCPTGTMHKSP